MEKDERAERLAAALRENLKRRKAQARGLDEPSPASPARGESSGHG
ncbi:hypothetical protein RN629_06940 [Sphingomonadaceae bacterium jetA1]|jgi:hypothetical protein